MQEAPWLVGLDVIGAEVGLGDTVGLGVEGATGLEAAIFTSAQLKNCSGQVVPLVPSLGYGGVHSFTPDVQYDPGRFECAAKYSLYPGGEHELAVVYFH
mmetsp:Transcript_18275/g.39477  ORF Transcript_18275/g.39477 Transcript_18275/m.39477 type:complete len:99 (+) Transcript_18275:3595-3891(+)